jgi:tRNA dimethylallyltransferase
LTVVVAVVGPTATGKSDLGLALAERLGGEVVNADALQLYRGMDIGTAKLSTAERHGVPHHQLDVLDPHEDATVAAYQESARADLADIAARGHRAVVVGGSGLYVRALLDRMEFPGTDPQVRADLEARVEAEGSRALHAELTCLDPVPAVQIGLDCDRAVLDTRVAARVDRMWAAGLVDEVRALAAAGIGRTASRAVGYAEVLAVLRGEITEDEAREQTVAGTRRLARKQMGWFGRDPRVHWLDAQDPDLVDRALALVAAADAGTLGPATEDPAPRRSLGS